jgi:hypothetical protein
MLPTQDIHEVLAALDAAANGISKAQRLLREQLPESVDRVDEAAHRHLEVLEQKGQITVADSLEIRRELYGEAVRGSASLFGRKGEGALLWRDVPYGTRTKPDQLVHLTDAGIARAKRYRQDHGLDLGSAATA